MSTFRDTSEIATGYPLDKVVVFDTETTGVNVREDEVLSIAICDAFGKVLFKSYVKPVRHLSWPEAQKVNGISPAMVSSAPTLAEIAPEIRKHLLGNRLVVGYHVSFDLNMLVGNGALEDWPAAVFDVMTEYARFHGTIPSRYGSGFKRSKLGVCADSYGYSFAAHDAAEDAKATAWCYRALVNDESFLQDKVIPYAERLRSFSMGQVKESTENVLALVDEGVTSSVDAVLKLGEITRGQNKGMPRYECFAGGRLVGVSSMDATDNVKLLMCVDGETLPEAISCKALLSASGKSAKCSVKITEDAPLERTVFAMARQARNDFGFEYRAPKRASKASNQTPKVPMRGSVPAAPPSGSFQAPEKKKPVVPWAAASALFAASGIYGLTDFSSTDVATWVISEALIVAIAVIAGRKAAKNHSMNRKK